MEQPRQIEMRQLANELRLLAQPSQLKMARDYAWQVATAFGFDPDSCYELVYAVNEAVTNAMRHGARDGRGNIRLSVWSEANRLTFAVRDCGRFTTPLQTDASTSEHGRGFALMANLVDEVRLRIEANGTTVTLSKACPAMSPT